MPRTASVPCHHTALHLPDPYGRAVRLILTKDGVHPEFRDYARSPWNDGYSRAWWRKAMHAIGLLIDHRTALAIAEGGQAPWGPRYLRGFKLDLRHGTDIAKGPDRRRPPDLGWSGRSEQTVSEIVWHVSRFGDFCSATYGWPQLNPPALNDGATAPRPPAPRTGTTIGERASASRVKRMVAVRLRHKEPAYKEPPAFPAGRFDDLLDAFHRRGARDGQPPEVRLHLRDVMIALLQGAGGLRCCEAFHLFDSDVDEDPARPGVARVRVHHPIDSAVDCPDPVAGRMAPVRRADFLRVEHLVPRNLAHGAKAAGWKNPRIYRDGAYQYMEVEWHPIRYGAMFLDLYDKYTRHQRTGSNPYLFHNDAGGIYALRQYEKKLSLACRRIGVPPTKRAGGTSHGLRHHFAQALKRRGLSNRDIAEALHQNDEYSANTYTRASASERAEHLRGVEPLTANVVIPALPPARGQASADGANR